MEKLTQKWAVISLLEDAQDGAEFYYTNFPLHVTLAGVFGIDKDGAWLVDGLTRLLSTKRAYEIETDAKDMFGPNRDVAVMKIKKTTQLMSVYQQIYIWLNNSGAKYIAPEYQGEGYIPHCTFQKTSTLVEGDVVHIKSVSIIDLFPNSDGYQRKIYKTIELL